MRYSEIKRQIKEIDTHEAERRLGADRILRILGNLVCPFLIMLRVPANYVTCIILLMTICSSTIIVAGWNGGLALGTLIYLCAVILDYCDGTIARYNGTANFFGRFIDGLFDAINLAIFAGAIALYAITNFDLNWIIKILCLLSPPMAIAGCLVSDRYSTMVRWINETHDVNIPPTIKAQLPKFLLNYFYDFRLLAIISILFYPDFTVGLLLVMLLTNIISIGLYVRVASRCLNYSAPTGRVH